MMQSSKDRYTGDAYLKQNPEWNLEDAGWKAARIMAMVKRNRLEPESMVDIGCGAGGILKELKQLFGRSMNLRGYDISPAAIQLARAENHTGIQFLNEDFPARDEAPADLTLLIDVIEHIDDYFGFLRRLRQNSRHVIFHVPLDLSLRSMLKPHIIKQQRDSVGHIHYFNREMLFWSLADTGFQILDWEYTKPVTDWSRSPGVWRFVKKQFRNLSFHFFPSLSAKFWGEYSVLVLAK